jgi:hypothetical protein
MSQHQVKSALEGRPVDVTAGFDRRLRQFFLYVLDDGPRDDECVFYTSLNEPWLDWTDVETLAVRLQELGLQVPETLLPELSADAASNAGNRIVRHQDRGRPTVLLEG